MFRRIALVLPIVLVLGMMLVACGASGPTKVTLKHDGTFVQEAFDADGDPFMQEVGAVPQGAVCDFQGGFVEGWDRGLYAKVENCTLDGVNYGGGAVSVERLVEADALRELAKQR